MTRRTATFAGIVIALFVAACGGGGSGELSLEQYFDRVASIVGDLEERTASLDQPLEQDFNSDAEQIEAFRNAFTTVIPFFRDFVDDLNEIDPPTVVADAHSELVAAFAGVAGGLEDFIDQLAEVETASEFSDLLFAPDSAFGSAIGQLTIACLKLQSTAADNDIDADPLECAG